MTGNLQEALAVPHVLDVSTRRTERGEWVCRLEYIELNGCVAEAPDVFDALDLVEALRVRWLEERLSTGRTLPSPRAGLPV